MITIQNLSKRYGNNTVLKDISIQLDAGKIYGLVGANGCGKTTRCAAFAASHNLQRDMS